MKKVAGVLCLLLVFIAGALAEQYPQIANVYNRKITSLNGKWKYIIDQGDIGRKRGFWLQERPESRSDLVEYSFETARQLDVPGDWNSQSDELLYYEGKIWYQRDFSFSPDEEKRYFLYFGAANYHTEAYLNGKRLGSHKGGFNPFNFEITSLLQDKNSLVISVDNSRHEEQVPTLVSDWKNFGGITRDVLILEENDSFIRDFSIQLKPGSGNTIEAGIALDRAVETGEVVLEIPELNIREKIRINNSDRGSASFAAGNLLYWSPEHPKTYEVHLSWGGATLSDRIGFRTIQTSGTDILLNGKPVFLRGISIHEENPFTRGRVHAREEARMLLNWARELGCNFVRLAHYPHNEHMIRLADEMGLLVWEEIPVYWDIQWDSPRTLSLASEMLDDLITRDRNRASVIIWSVANETDISEHRNLFLRSLIDQAREKDPYRLISAALLANGENHNSRMKVVNDPFGEYVDIISINHYTGWYGSALPDALKQVDWEVKFDKPFFFSEFGAGALAGYHADSLTRWSEEYQAWYYRETLSMCERIDQLRGMSPWILTDFQSPRRPLGNIQDGFNRKGLISSKGEKKMAFYILQNFYLSKQ
ncbi:MAG: beta-glucuronidase [Bacteroidetes bacterium]|nr:MAG: beta-glucuronidase [Bacteroidota bacterium]